MTNVDPNNEGTFRTCIISSDYRQTHVAKNAVVKELNRHGFREKAVFAVKLALEEALANAVKHGNECDPSKKIIVRYAVNSEKAVIVVRDEGAGFEPDQVPDPTTPERLPIPSGRGIMLIRAYMDEVQFRDNGCELYLVKNRR